MSKIIQILNTILTMLILAGSFFISMLSLALMNHNHLERILFPERLSLIVIFIIAVVYFIILILSFIKKFNYYNDKSRSLYKLAFFSNIIFVLSLPLYLVNNFFAPLVALVFLTSFFILFIGFMLRMGITVEAVLPMMKIIFYVIIFLFLVSYIQDINLINKSYPLQGFCVTKECSDFKTEDKCSDISQELLCNWKDNQCIRTNCSTFENKNDCNTFGGDKSCIWKDSICQEVRCGDIEIKEDCLSIQNSACEWNPYNNEKCHHNEEVNSFSMEELKIYGKCDVFSENKKDCLNNEICKYHPPLNCSRRGTCESW